MDCKVPAVMEKAGCKYWDNIQGEYKRHGTTSKAHVKQNNYCG